MRRPYIALFALLFALASGALARGIPQVARTEPSNGAVGVARKGLEVRIWFSHDMDPATMNRETVQPGYTDPGLRFVRDPFLGTGYRYEKESRILVVSLPPLLPEKEVSLLLTDGVRTVDGRPLSGEGPSRYELRFATGGKE